MKTILEKFDNIADMSRKLSDMIDAQEGGGHATSGGASPERLPARR